MVNNSSHSLDTLFHALSDPTRRSMLQALARQPHKVGELAAPFRMSLAAASKHIKVLESAGLIRREIDGRTHTCHLEAMPMHAGLEWIRHYERFWSGRLDALEALLLADDAARSVPAPIATRQLPPQQRKRKKKE